MDKDKLPDNSSVNIDLIRGHMDTIILRTLSNEDKYGYEILDEIKGKSNNLYSLKQPTLYSCLKRLEKQGLITSYKGDLSYGAQRVYYTLTDLGKQFLENDQIQWEFSRTIINSLLSDRDYDPDKQPTPFDVSQFRPLTRRQRTDANYIPTEKEIEENSVEVDNNLVEDIDDEIPCSDDAVNQIDIAEQNTITECVTYERPQQYNIKEEFGYDELSVDESEEFGNGKNNQNRFVEKTTENSLYTYDYSVEHSAGDKSADISDYRKVFAEDMLYGNGYIAKDDDSSSVDKSEKSEFADYTNDGTYAVTEDRGANYIESFNKLYNRSENENIEEAYTPRSAGRAVNADYIEDELTLNQLREKMYHEGYTLKPYSKQTASSFYVNRYFYSNRLMKDCTLIMFLLFTLELIITAIAGGITWGVAGIMVAVSFLIGAIAVIIYAVNPNKRIKASFSAKNTLINCLIVIISSIAIIFILGFYVFDVQIGASKSWIKPIVIPLVYLLNIPISVGIYAKLYYTKHYHIN